MKHCFLHTPTSLVAVPLTLVLAFNLFAAFVCRHSPLCRRRRWTGIAIARQLYRSLFFLSPPDRPRLLLRGTARPLLSSVRAVLDGGW